MNGDRDDFFSIANIKQLYNQINDITETKRRNTENFLIQLRDIMEFACQANPDADLYTLNNITITDAIKLIKETETYENDKKEEVYSTGTEGILLAADRKNNEIFIHIDSRYRDVKIWKNPSRYRFSINGVSDQLRGIINSTYIQEVRNIIEFKLVDAMIGNINNPEIPEITDIPYLYMNIDEIEGDFHTSFLNGFRVFGKMSNIIATNQIRSFTPLTVDKCVKIYDTYRAKDSLPTITINILDPSGELFDFGPDALDIISITPANPTEITTSVPHDLITDNTIYLVDVTGTDVDVELNRIQGYVITVTGVTTFTIPVNVGIAGVTGIVIVGKRQNNFLFSLKMLPREVSQAVK